MKQQVAGTLSKIMFLLFLTGCGTGKSEYWEFDNLARIGGHEVTVFGNPELVDTESGKAIQFDGIEDMLLVDHNPLGDANEFTVEVVFKPDACYPENVAPRFIHIQDPNDPDAKRLMIELRLNEKNECYLDSYLQTDKDKLALIDSTLVHPTEKWIHAAVTYKNKVLTTYIDGKKQLSGDVDYADRFINPTGKTAIGGRMNHEQFFRGMVRTLKITKEALPPEKFCEVKK